MKKRVVILGSGESGTGAALLAASKGYDVFVSDQGHIKDKYKNDLRSANITFEEGIHSDDKILNADLIIKSPGISDKAEIIKTAKAKHISIIDEIEFAFRYCDGKKGIAITGTNGKTTTTLLTYHLLKEAGLNVALAGNVGFSMARQIIDNKFDWYVLEMSSFQIDGIDTFKPEIAILLNITPDHLDRYEYNMQNYVNSKFNLVKNMTTQQDFIFYSDDVVIAREITSRPIVPLKFPVSLNNDDNTRAHFDGEKMVFELDEKFSIRQEETTLKGPHNLINTMAAVIAAYRAGVKVETIRKGLATFKNAPHRLEPVGTINGVEFVNDSKATNVDSVVYALGSYEKPLVWIAGGVDKGNDYNLISQQVKQKVKALICLGKENQKLFNAFSGVVPVVKETQSVKELVRIAISLASKGDVVLLSPACASFDLFKNYEDRGNQFREAVQELKKEIEG
ncbi:MAG TPA: UDP-N-acetylmuramoyl-L-alanine--D-glutamate ligase [Chryseosolibacter sp.]|nr:UDP-N-acetylmuramoyl-L-alanine--D-glutamate ligase [Chryseosolibacter sp.]